MRLPLKLRLTLAFTVSMALLLAGAGAFLYVRLGTELLRSTDSALRAQADALVAGIGQQGLNFGDQSAVGAAAVEMFAQVVDPSGRIVESTSAESGIRWVSAAQLAAVKGPTFLERRAAGTRTPIRLLVVPADEPGQRLYVVAGSSLESRQEVLSRFLFVLTIGGTAALALASAAGWALAGAALRPVERMRREAAAISVSDQRRLPVPETGDEIERLGATLNSMLDRLQQAFNRERRFVDDASHELRSPLTILKAELDLALARPRTPPELEDALRSASVEADRLAALAEDLLLYSRSDGGRVPVHRAEVRLDEVLREAVSAHAIRAEEAGVCLEVDAPEETIWVDAARVRQAVDNLLGNAISHTPRGGRVSVRAVREGSNVRLVFDDTGGGFPPEFIDRAFEPFARADAERAGAPVGAGLGLAIVRVVAEAHGGSATAENLPNGGARVTLVLQAVPSASLA